MPLLSAYPQHACGPMGKAWVLDRWFHVEPPPPR